MWPKSISLLEQKRESIITRVAEGLVWLWVNKERQKHWNVSIRESCIAKSICRAIMEKNKLELTF